MRLVVADASALAEFLLRTERGEAIRRSIEEPEVDLHSPALCDVEIAAVLRRALLLESLGRERARQAVADYLDLPLVRHGHRRLLPRILELRENFSACDAAYVALAEAIGAALLTADRALARAAHELTGLRTLPD